MPVDTVLDTSRRLNDSMAITARPHRFDSNRKSNGPPKQFIEIGDSSLGASAAAQVFGKYVVKWQKEHSWSSSGIRSTLLQRSFILQQDKEPLPVKTERFRSKVLGQLIATIELEAIEDGIFHSGEAVICKFLEEGELPYLAEWICDPTNLLASSVVQLLGRASKIDLGLRIKIAKYSLASANIQLRDSIVQAIELWEDAEFIPILEEHHETVSWLADYIAEVTLDLKG